MGIFTPELSKTWDDETNLQAWTFLDWQDLISHYDSASCLWGLWIRKVAEVPII